MFDPPLNFLITTAAGYHRSNLAFNSNSKLKNKAFVPVLLLQKKCDHLGAPFIKEGVKTARHLASAAEYKIETHSQNYHVWRPRSTGGSTMESLMRPCLLDQMSRHRLCYMGCQALAGTSSGLSKVWSKEPCRCTLGFCTKQRKHPWMMGFCLFSSRHGRWGILIMWITRIPQRGFLYVVVGHFFSKQIWTLQEFQRHKALLDFVSPKNCSSQSYLVEHLQKMSPREDPHSVIPGRDSDIIWVLQWRTYLKLMQVGSGKREY